MPLKKRFPKEEQGSTYSVINSGRKESGKSGKEPGSSADVLNREILEFRKKRFHSGVFLKKLEAPEDVNTNPVKYPEAIERLVARNCGDNYIFFLKSGHPWARFWAQLKIDIVVIPKSEYVYYLQSILEVDVDHENESQYSNARMKKVFMDKYGFQSDEEVVEFLMCELELKQLMPVEESQSSSG